jgi:hypothetical protein
MELSFMTLALICGLGLPIHLLLFLAGRADRIRTERALRSALFVLVKRTRR